MSQGSPVKAGKASRLKTALGEETVTISLQRRPRQLSSSPWNNDIVRLRSPEADPVSRGGLCPAGARTRE